ncbi:hypothetical protein GCM10028799_83370 [Kribbella italica]
MRSGRTAASAGGPAAYCAAGGSSALASALGGIVTSRREGKYRADKDAAALSDLQSYLQNCC